jgi:hypothetical protein
MTLLHNGIMRGGPRCVEVPDRGGSRRGQDSVPMRGRTRHWSRQGKSETLGLRAHRMKLVAVPQWVRAQAQVPPDPSLASRSEVPSTCTPRHGRTELDGMRMQAACSSPDQGHVVDNRITRTALQRGMPTVSRGRKAAVLGAGGRGRRTPPGSQSGAGRHRGSAGTWESPLSPWHTPGMGDRVTQGPGVVWEFRPEYEPVRAPTNGPQQARYRGASAKRRVPRGAERQS